MFPCSLSSLSLGRLARRCSPLRVRLTKSETQFYLCLSPIQSLTKPSLRSLEFQSGSSFTADPIIPPPNQIVIVIIGPSGVGKDAVINKLREFPEEFRHLKNFDYVVVNAKGRLDDAVNHVESIIDAEKSKVHQRIVRI